jgi:hypothetical protein
MKLISAVVITLLLTFTGATAQTGSNKASLDNPSPLEQELRSLEHELHATLIRGDKEHLFSFFADDFVGTSYEGYTVTKAELVKSFRLPPSEAKITREIEDFKVSGSGDVAVANYRLIERVEIAGQKKGAEYLYTDTFVRRDGRWQMMASHATGLEPERKVAKIDPSIYDAYVGQYELSPTLIFSVRREGDKLIGTPPNGREVELLPENESTFFVEGLSVRTVFVKDASGQVTQMIFRGQGDDLKMKKIN